MVASVYLIQGRDVAHVGQHLEGGVQAVDMLVVMAEHLAVAESDGLWDCLVHELVDRTSFDFLQHLLGLVLCVADVAANLRYARLGYEIIICKFKDKDNLRRRRSLRLSIGDRFLVAQGCVCVA